MNVSSILGCGELLGDPIVKERSTGNGERFQPQIPSSSSPSEAAPQTGISSHPGSLLASSTGAELLKATDAAPLASSTVQEPKTISREDVLNAIKRSKSYADGNGSDGDLLGETYTSKDVGFIRGTTGYNIISIGKLTAVVDDDGNPPPSAETLTNVDSLALAIHSGRTFGSLTGEITPEIAKDMIGSYTALVKSFPKDWLDNALSYLNGATDSKSAAA